MTTTPLPRHSPGQDLGSHLLQPSCKIVSSAALAAESLAKEPVAEETKSAAAEITAPHADLRASLSTRRKPEFLVTRLECTVGRPFMRQLECVSMALRVRRHDNAEDIVRRVGRVAGVGSADVRAEVWHGLFDDLVHWNGDPANVLLDFVSAFDRAGRRRAAMHQMSARSLSVGSVEGAVETLMPFVVAVADKAFLRPRRADADDQHGCEHDRHHAKRGAIQQPAQERVLSRKANKNDPENEANQRVHLTPPAARSGSG